MFKFNQVRFKNVVNTGTATEKRCKVFFTVIYTIDGESKEEPFIVNEDGGFESNLDEKFQEYVNMQKEEPEKGMTHSERVKAMQAVVSYVGNLIRDLDCFPPKKQMKNA